MFIEVVIDLVSRGLSLNSLFVPSYHVMCDLMLMLLSNELGIISRVGAPWRRSLRENEESKW